MMVMLRLRGDTPGGSDGKDLPGFENLAGLLFHIAPARFGEKFPGNFSGLTGLKEWFLLYSWNCFQLMQKLHSTHFD